MLLDGRSTCPSPRFHSLVMHPHVKLLPSASGATGIFLLLRPAVPANASLVVNGDFQDATAKDPTENPASIGGTGQIDNLVSLPTAVIYDSGKPPIGGWMDVHRQHPVQTSPHTGESISVPLNGRTYANVVRIFAADQAHG